MSQKSVTFAAKLLVEDGDNVWKKTICGSCFTMVWRVTSNIATNQIY